jgi:hypothetical protein
LASHGHRLSKTEDDISPFYKRHHAVEHADRSDNVADVFREIAVVDGEHTNILFVDDHEARKVRAAPTLSNPDRYFILVLRESPELRLGSKGDIDRRPDYICFTAKIGHRRCRARGPFGANTRHGP